MDLNKKEKILITGGGGFLGSAIAKLLLKNNYEVISFSRNAYPELTKLGIKQIQGNLTDSKSIQLALDGIDAVIHTASRVGMHGTYEEFYSTNFLGTKNLVDSMIKSNITKLIYTSTPSVVFGKDDIINADESMPYPNSYLTHYAHTKKLAEEYVIQNSTPNFKTLTLRPHLIFGPGDLNLIPRLIDSHKNNRLKIIGEGKNLVDVIFIENAAMAHFLALQKINSLKSGSVYFIGQGPVNLWTFINEVLGHFKLQPIKKKISLELAYALGALIEVILKVLGKSHVHPTMSRFIALQLGKSHYFNHKKSISELGDYHLVSVQEGIRLL